MQPLLSKYLFKAVLQESKKEANYAEYYRGRNKIKVTKAEKGSGEVGGSHQMPTTLQPPNVMFHLLIFIPSLHFRGWSLGCNLLSVHIARSFFFPFDPTGAAGCAKNVFA